jgi:hypothetical protein
MTVLIYVDTSKQVGDPDHLKVFADADAAEAWFEENDPEGVAFEYEVLEPKAASIGLRNLSLAGAGRAFDGIDFAARLYRLHHDGKARSVASNARMFFDPRRHTEPFRPHHSASCPAYIRTLPGVVIRSLPSR